MTTQKKIKLSEKQKEIVGLMRDGWMFFCGRSEHSGRLFFYVSIRYEKVYFNATVFSNLLLKDLIFQQQHHPFDYILTELGRTIPLD